MSSTSSSAKADDPVNTGPMQFAQGLGLLDAPLPQGMTAVNNVNARLPRRIRKQPHESRGGFVVARRARICWYDPRRELLLGQTGWQFPRLEVGGNQHERVVARRGIGRCARPGIMAHPLTTLAAHIFWGIPT